MKGIASRRGWIWGPAVLAVLLGLGWLSTLFSHPVPPPPLQPLGEWDTNPAAWGLSFPRQYHSWLGSQRPASEDIGYGPGCTKWAGLRSIPDKDRSSLLAGYALSRDADSSPSGALRHPATCQDCHHPSSLALRVSRKPFAEAMAQRGIDVSRASRQSLRTYVCAQCHASAFTPPGASSAQMPWGRGLNLDDISAVFREDVPGFSDWTHAVSNSPMVKIRHPEFELWNQGSHAASSVSCADCHMPTIVEGTAIYSNHQMKSPLLDKALSGCAACHRWETRGLRAQVEQIQDGTLALQRRAEIALLTAHAAVGACAKAGIPDPQLAPLRSLIREAQVRWDFIASEHSHGFHAPQEAARVLGTAIDQAGRAERKAQTWLEKAQTHKPAMID